ncbi:hypothetical protein B0H19DRAFT_238975 [Mycena capillaripes]|nr:hypothetical protein B0H19DRAFT_238975 [Mycena capillaripes]
MTRNRTNREPLVCAISNNKGKQNRTHNPFTWADRPSLSHPSSPFYIVLTVLSRLSVQVNMPTNPLPYQCGTPGCTRKFGKPEDLCQHTKDFHSSLRSMPSRPAPSRPAPSRPAPGRPPPNQPTLPYQCGTPGCTRKFAKPEDLHRHTKDFHSPSTPASSRPAKPTDIAISMRNSWLYSKVCDTGRSSSAH